MFICQNGILYQIYHFRRRTRLVGPTIHPRCLLAELESDHQERGDNHAQRRRQGVFVSGDTQLGK